MKNVVLALVAALALSVGAFAQTSASGSTPVVPDPLESGWNVAISGNYANVSKAPTNNGFNTGVSIRIAQHWDIRSDVYLLNSPQGMTLTLGGLEYRESLAHLFKHSNFMINASRMEGFVNVAAGDAKTGTVIVNPDGSSVTQVSRSKFAYAVGGGFDIAVSPTVTIRPLDIKYVRSSFLNAGGGVYGNQIDFAAGLGLRF